MSIDLVMDFLDRLIHQEEPAKEEDQVLPSYRMPDAPLRQLNQSKRRNLHQWLGQLHDPRDAQQQNNASNKCQPKPNP